MALVHHFMCMHIFRTFFLIVYTFNTLNPEQSGRGHHIADAKFKCILLKNFCILIKISQEVFFWEGWGGVGVGGVGVGVGVWGCGVCVCVCVCGGGGWYIHVISTWQ